jgi:hypothetical protein
MTRKSKGTLQRYQNNEQSVPPNSDEKQLDGSKQLGKTGNRKQAGRFKTAKILVKSMTNESREPKHGYNKMKK